VNSVPDAVDWVRLASVLAEIEAILRQEEDEDADYIARLKEDVEGGRREEVLTIVTSGNMWGHMGSFFDRSLSDSDLDREFRRTQIRLADFLEEARVATTDVTRMAAILRRWDADGL
jgi:hypothetical protein